MLTWSFLLIVTCLVLSLFSTEATAGNEDESNQARGSSCSMEANTPRNEGAQRPKVVVIGCGPGGMFFLHALATKRRKLEEACDAEGLAAFPEVTVYEKASDPGGVWRPNTETERASGSVNMFGGLWSNSPSYDTEFFDYTYKDHFGGPVPLYFPRAHFLEYMLARVTNVEDIFQHVQFSTQVTWASYNEDDEKFVVETKNVDTEKETVAEFDKLIWAGGVLSELNYPKATHSRLMNGGFKGLIKHSAEIVDMDSSIEGKRILLVGDSYSAEDLTLQALKLNAQHVYITSARGRKLASSTSTWPGNKAESLRCLPTQVINDGTGVLCSQVKYDGDIGDYVPIEGGESWELEDIAAVIYCTGYRRNMRYLDEDLQYGCYSDEWSAPEGWQSQRNSLTKFVGNVEPAEELSRSYYVCDNMYRHVLIDNPNMMYVHWRTVFFLSEIDATAWALAAYVSGETVLPTAEEMETRNYLEKLDELHTPWHRYHIDFEYAEATMPLYGDAEHWLNTPKNLTAGYGDYLREYISHALKLIARDQVAGGHGGDWGSYDKLSVRGEKLVDQLVQEYYGSRMFPIIEEETEWRTFRDIDPTPYESIYTGIKAAPLKGHWMDLGDDGNLLPHCWLEPKDDIRAH
jgi:hypothetical protein